MRRRDERVAAQKERKREKEREERRERARAAGLLLKKVSPFAFAGLYELWFVELIDREARCHQDTI